MKTLVSSFLPLVMAVCFFTNKVTAQENKEIKIYIAIAVNHLDTNYNKTHGGYVVVSGYESDEEVMKKASEKLNNSGLHSRNLGHVEETFWGNCCSSNKKPWGNYMCVISGEFENHNGVTVKNYSAGFGFNAEDAKKQALDRLKYKAKVNYKVVEERIF